MKRVAVIGLLLVGCYYRPPEDPELVARLAKVQVTKQDPQGCDYVTAGNAIAQGTSFQLPTYEMAIKELQKTALAHNANVVVMDSAMPPTPRMPRYVITARWYRCP